jgi:hypothetical protein
VEKKEVMTDRLVDSVEADDVTIVDDDDEGIGSKGIALDDSVDLDIDGLRRRDRAFLMMRLVTM